MIGLDESELIEAIWYVRSRLHGDTLLYGTIFYTAGIENFRSSLSVSKREGWGNHSRLRVPLPLDPPMLPRNLIKRIPVSGEIRRHLWRPALKMSSALPGGARILRWEIVHMESEVRYRKSSYIT
jgi:hypothetical protein